MDNHPIDLLIERKIRLVQEIESYLDDLARNKYKHFKVKKMSAGTYWITIDYNVIFMM